MCLILIAWRHSRCHPLVVAANRDEFYARPAAPADFWDDAPQVLAGRDLEAGGTWLGVSRTGRFAAVTNYRDPAARMDAALSRGALVADFLAGDAPAENYVAHAAGEGARYNGFSLVVADEEALWWCSNRGGDPRRLEPGVHGISNGLIDDPWPKVDRGRALLRDIVGGGSPEPEALFEMLRDRFVPEDDLLPDTGVGPEWERVFAPLFIESEHYGTRCSTVVIADAAGGVRFLERTHEPGSLETRDVDHWLVPAAKPTLGAAG